MKKHITLIAILSLLCVMASGENRQMDRYIDHLMARMSLEEKIGQLNLPVGGTIVTGEGQSSDVASKIRQGAVGGVFNLKGLADVREAQRLAVEESRLGIPLIFGMDVIHGFETIFPIPLGMAATWDMSEVRRSAEIAASEASAYGINWTFSPMVDIARDPRWGRMSEGAGEDPYLGSAIAREMVLGYQGESTEDLFKRDDRMMACIKHFALYGAAESGRDYNSVDMSLGRMYNEYFPPYRAAVDAGAGSVMVSFNDINGVPATANRWLMQDVLRDGWGFDGFVVTDYTGIKELTAHGLGDLKTVSARALQAGVDMDMVSEGFLGTLKQSLQDGTITIDAIDQACRRVLEAKYRLGLFKDPYKYIDERRVAERVYTATNRAEARRIAADSFVLLKNDNGVLPLKKNGKIALIGPMGDSRVNMSGTWCVAARDEDYLSLREGLEFSVGDDAEILYSKGSNLCSDPELEQRALGWKELHRDERSDEELLRDALQVAREADVIIAALGESAEMSGESSCRVDIGIPDVQRRLLEALVATGKPVVLVLFNGRAMTIDWESTHVPAILDVWFGGSEAGLAISDVLFGDVNPSGRLPVTFPKSIGQVPLYYAHKSTGRPLDEDNDWFTKFRSNYLDVDNDPTYPFGYGLSYTTFDYSPVTLSSTSMSEDGSITASVVLTNNGPVRGKEVIQMYIRDIYASITRPVRELKGFTKVELEPGQSQTISFTIDRETLSFYNEALEHVAEPGDFQVFIGPDSTTSNSADFTLQ